MEFVEYLDYYNNRRIKARLKGLLPAIQPPVTEPPATQSPDIPPVVTSPLEPDIGDNQTPPRG